MEKGRGKELVPMDDDEVSRKDLEKRLRKMVQREVIQLLNAVGAAEIKREEGSRVGKSGGGLWGLPKGRRKI